MVTKLSMTRVFAMDDVFVIASLVCNQVVRYDKKAHIFPQGFSVGMTISISIETTNGLGKHEADLSEAQMLRFQKASKLAPLRGDVPICRLSECHLCAMEKWVMEDLYASICLFM